jgi:hypothetical protein
MSSPLEKAKYPQMSLSAWLISKFNTHSTSFTTLSTRSRVRYTLFLSIWTMIFSAIYLALALGARIRGGLGSWASHLFSFASGSSVSLYLTLISDVQSRYRLGYVARLGHLDLSSVRRRVALLEKWLGVLYAAKRASGTCLAYLVRSLSVLEFISSEVWNVLISILAAG